MSVLQGRQNVNYDDAYYDGFWYSQNGQITRWAVFGSIIAAVIIALVVSYTHAKRRIRKGLPPLPYHRWLLSREDRARSDPSYQLNQQNYYYHINRPEQYGMNSYPPPVYDENSAPPPTYQPPAGGSKVDPSQWRAEPTRRPAQSDEEYAAPLGPPPAAVLHSNQEGSSSMGNSSFRP